MQINTTPTLLQAIRQDPDTGLRWAMRDYAALVRGIARRPGRHGLPRAGRFPCASLRARHFGRGIRRHPPGGGICLGSGVVRATAAESNLTLETAP